MQNAKKKLCDLVNFITKLNLFVGYCLSFVLLLFGSAMLYEAISRHFFSSPTTWVFELSKMAFGFYMIWGGAYTMVRGEHVSMDLLYSKWSPRTKAVMDSFTFIFFIIFISTLMYLVTCDAVNSAVNYETSNSTLAQPLYHWRLSLSVGIFLLLLQGLSNFIRNIWLSIYGEEL